MYRSASAFLVPDIGTCHVSSSVSDSGHVECTVATHCEGPTRTESKLELDVRVLPHLIASLLAVLNAERLRTGLAKLVITEDAEDEDEDEF